MVLSVNHLKVSFDTTYGKFFAVDDISFDIPEGQCLGLIGESGSGKSVTALSIIGLTPYAGGQIESGNIFLGAEDILQLEPAEWTKVRGKKISMIFQEPMTSLNPVFKVGDQVVESLLTHQSLAPNEAYEKALEVLDLVGIPDPKRRFDFYPHELSGGLRQRMMIAMALACEPDLLIADEPTTALDVTIQAQILELLRSLQDRLKMSLLLITHDFGVVAEMAQEVAVMYAGKIVEKAPIDQLMTKPEHPYTRALQRSIPHAAKRSQRLYSIPFHVPKPSDLVKGIDFSRRWAKLEEELDQLSVPSKEDSIPTQNFSIDPSGEEVTAKVLDSKVELLRVQGLTVRFPIRRSALGKAKEYISAVQDVSFTQHRGEVLGLVGESGCGKSTIAKSIVHLVRPTSGEISFRHDRLDFKKKPEDRKKIQMIFQDPFSSLNPRMRVGEILEEPLRIHFDMSSGERRHRVVELLQTVGLSEDAGEKWPHEFSGGQRQRIGIARALAVDPELIIADEPVSALDVSIQAQILNLLQDLKKRFNLSLLFISHDLNVVQYLCDRILVMNEGKIVEELRPDQVINKDYSKHPYTQRLLDAVPKGYSKLLKHA